MVRGESQETWNRARRPSVAAGRLQEIPEAFRTRARRTSTLSLPLPCATETVNQGLDHTWGSVQWERNSVLGETKARGTWGPGLEEVSRLLSPGRVRRPPEEGGERAQPPVLSPGYTENHLGVQKTLRASHTPDPDVARVGKAPPGDSNAQPRLRTTAGDSQSPCLSLFSPGKEIRTSKKHQGAAVARNTSPGV